MLWDVQQAVKGENNLVAQGRNNSEGNHAKVICDIQCKQQQDLIVATPCGCGVCTHYVEMVSARAGHCPYVVVLRIFSTVEWQDHGRSLEHLHALTRPPPLVLITYAGVPPWDQLQYIPFAKLCLSMRPPSHNPLLAMVSKRTSARHLAVKKLMWDGWIKFSQNFQTSYIFADGDNLRRLYTYGCCLIILLEAF